MIDFKQYKKEHRPVNRQDVKRIFVFGSNKAGVHGKGAALFAKKFHEAEQGVGEGLTGLSYALPTKDRNIRSLTLKEVEESVGRFLDFAADHPEMDFIVTRVGCGLAGFKDEEIAPLFENATRNCLLPGKWLPGVSLVIAGSRDLHEEVGIDQDEFNELIDHITRNIDPSKLRVVSGGAAGADLMGERWAHQKGVPIVRFDAEWGRLGKSAGMVRNNTLAQSGSHLAAYMKPGGSPGTNMMIKIAQEQGLVVRSVELKRKKNTP